MNTKLIAAIVLFAMLAGLVLGILKYGEGQYTKGHEAGYAKRDAQQKEADLKTVDKIKQKDLQNAELVKALEEQKVVYETKVQKLLKRKPKYVTKIQTVHSECNISRGIVGLLNESSGHSERGTDDSTALTVEERKQVSTVTESELIDWCQTAAQRHSETRTRLNALIDVVENNQSN